MDQSQSIGQTRQAGQLDELIAAFESARARGLQPDLEEFLPAPGHPLRLQALACLIRLDRAYRIDGGQSHPLPDYRGRFPELADDPAVLQELAGPASPSPAPAQDPGTRVLEDSSHARLKEAALAYQRFRELHPRADAGALQSWCETFSGSAEHAELFRRVHRSDPQSAYRLAQALTSMPEVGSMFLGFRLISELGRGTFGRVYLARQGDLADRFVALKVAVDLHGESQALAQLQHTNIVPIYSVHRYGPYHAVCMPYLGGTTLADVLRDLARWPRRPDSGSSLVGLLSSSKVAQTLQVPEQPAPAAAAPLVRPTLSVQKPPQHLLKRLGEWSYVEAVLWVGARLADGLAHAHERGIVHRDLKPANILLTDEGQPMLADFNLAEDTKLRCEGSVARVGGTLPYMAPEQLLSFKDRTRAVDGRSDVYGLGVILFELLTGRSPFPVHGGPLPQAVLRMLEDRSAPAPRLRRWNRAVSPAIESIVRHCLAFDPTGRYQSADELREDLQRQLEHRPLRFAPEPCLRERARKWVRRHPRLAARIRQGTTLLALLATLMLALLVVQSRRAEADARQRSEQSAREKAEEAGKLAQADAAKRAQDNFRRFRATMTTLGQLEDTLTAVRGVVCTCPEDGGRRAWAESLLHSALDLYQVRQRPAWKQQPSVTSLTVADRSRLCDDLGYCCYLLARLTAERRGRPLAERAGAALELNRAAAACYLSERVPCALLMQRATLSRLLGREAEAEKLDERAGGLRRRTPRDFYLEAYEVAARGRFRTALELAEKATRREPGRLGPWFLLALCHDNLFQDVEALGCYGSCIALNPGSAPSYFNRGCVRLRREFWPRAVADFSAALRLRPQLTDALANRAFARHGLKDYAAEIEDLTRALEQRPDFVQGYFARAGAYEKLGQETAAARDRAEGFRRPPDDEEGYLARARERLAKDPAAALADCDRALAINPHSLTALHQKGEILADHLQRYRDAVALLNRALELYPDFTPFRVNRGLLLARLEERTAALRDVAAVLAHNPRPLILYQVGCIYAQTSRQHPDDRRLALAYLADALRHGAGFDRLKDDRDLVPLRVLPEFHRLRDALSALPPGRPR